ncbi:hypothetical protein AGMMS49928_01020 [Spirochaetia bacterium]|nr:hypothetical protein AGMMS49928_01020 [Spirochaetia bacterium]
MLLFAIILFSPKTFAQNFSISVDPLTFLGLLFSSSDKNSEQVSPDIRNMWLCVELNIDTPKQKEIGFGIFARGDRIALRTQYRTFYNRERQSGFFWGFYGFVEWRQMYWLYDKNNELTIGWNFPFRENDNIYHSIGLTTGVDIGFRIRGDKVGITPYIGLGVPLFYCFGNVPPETDKDNFLIQNITFRAIDIGLRIDFFQ